MFIYLAVALFGFLLVVVSGFLGGEHGGDHHFELGGHDTEVHLDSVDGDHQLTHDGDNGPSIFSAMALSFFLLGFGASGATVSYFGLQPFMAALPALAGGGIAWWFVYLGLKFLYSQQTNSAISSQQLSGSTARVIMAIPVGEIGKVYCTVGQEHLELIAKSVDGSAIDLNEEVLLVGQDGNTYLVQKINALPSWRQ